MLTRSSKIPMRRKIIGLTIVELMVSIGIALFLAAVVASLFVASSRSRVELERISNQIENGRFVIDFLGEEIRHAGFFGATDRDHQFVGGVPNHPDPCSTNATNLLNGLGYPIGFLPELPASCQSTTTAYTYVSSTPVLVLRRASTAVVLPAVAAISSRYYVQSIPSASPRFAMGTDGVFNLRYDTGALAPIRLFQVRTFWIGNDASGLPHLILTEMNQSGVFSSTPLAAGVENVRYVFGIDNQTPIAPDGVADELVGGFTLAELKEDRLDIVSVRVDLVVRNAERTPGYEDQNTYLMGKGVYALALTPAGDAKSFKRNFFSSDFRVNNLLASRIYCPDEDLCL